MRTRFLTLTMILTSASAYADWQTEILTGMPRAFSGLTKQVERSQDAINESMVQSKRGLADLMTEVRIAKKTIQTSFDYMQVGPNGNATGNVPFICTSQSIKESAEEIAGLAQKSADMWADTIYKVSNKNNKVYTKIFGPISVSYRMSVPFTNQSVIRESTHFERYCTQSEADIGLCDLQPNGMQGADVDFSLIYGNDTMSSEKQVAMTHFAARIAPQVTVPTTIATSCTGSICKSASVTARQTEARVSMARNTLLRYIESRSTQNKSGTAGVLTN